MQIPPCKCCFKTFCFAVSARLCRIHLSTPFVPMVLYHPFLASVAGALLLVGCATPKATVVVEPTRPADKVETTSRIPAPKPAPDDGFRTGNLLELPKETEYRPTNPSLPKSNTHAGTVIVSPPNSPKPSLQAEEKPEP